MASQLGLIILALFWPSPLRTPIDAHFGRAHLGLLDCLCGPSSVFVLPYLVGLLGAPKMGINRGFYEWGDGQKSANMIRPSCQATVVHLWALLCYPGMA